MAEHFLTVRGIRKSFGGVEVLHGVDLDVTAGSVLALLGENGAGKSTLVRIIAGDHRPDSGEIAVNGTVSVLRDLTDAKRLGIRLIYQEINDAPPLTVAENVVLGDWPTHRGAIRRSVMKREAAERLNSLGVEVDLDAPVSSLSLGERQAIEIARALRGEARCLILDEPTAALSDAEADRLFTIIRELRSRGVAVVYITHRIDEVFRIADAVCVLRDGAVVQSQDLADLDRDRIVRAMVGHEVRGRVAGGKTHTPAEPILELDHASSGNSFTDVSMTMAPGDVLALYGKVGSGAAEVGEALFGARRLDAGQIRVANRTVRFTHPADAVAAGIGCVPGDRQGQAIFRTQSVAKNLAAASWGVLARLGFFISSRLESAAYLRWHEALSIRSRNDAAQEIWELSGGNQQKVVLGRWLERGSRILILIEPTRGVDVGARQEIYRAIRELAAKGSALLIVTSDYEDVIEAADAAVVMTRGRVTTELTREQLTIEMLTRAAGGIVHA